MISVRMLRAMGAGRGFKIIPYSLCSTGPKQRDVVEGNQSAVHLPNNVEELDAGQRALFSPERTRDISGPNIDSHFLGANGSVAAEGKHQAGEDAHVGAYACSGSGIHLNAAMQPNVPRAYESSGPSSGVGDQSSYVDNPPEGGHWMGGDKYVAEEQKNAHKQGVGGAGRKPGTATPRHSGRELASVVASCCTSSPPINQLLRWPNVFASHWPLGTRLWFPAQTTPCAAAYSTSVNNDNLNVAPLSRKDKLKKAVKDYGATVIVFHVGISLLSLGGFYLAVSSGLNVMDILSRLGVSGGTVATEAGTFAVAYLVHKAFAPVRISITLAATPFIVRYLRRVGVLKPLK